MRLPTLMLCFILLEETVCGVYIQEGCLSGQEKETTLRGTSLPITVWVPRIREGESFLALAASKEDIYYRLHVEVRPTSVHVNETRGSVDRHEAFEVPPGVIRPGWMDFELTLNSRFQLVVENLTLVEVEDVPTSSIAVRGSNVTAGCTEPFIIWEVPRGNETTVPILSEDLQHFSVFSKTASLPQLRLGHNTLGLGWDSVTKSVITLTSSPRPLPGFVLHDFIIGCHPRDALTTCDIKAGFDESLVGSALLSEEPTSISFRANEKDNFMVILKYPRQAPEEEPVVCDVPQVPSPQVEEEYQGWKVATIVCASLSSVLLIIVIALVVVIVKMRHETFDSPVVFRKGKTPNRLDDRERKQSPRMMENA